MSFKHWQFFRLVGFGLYLFRQIRFIGYLFNVKPNTYSHCNVKSIKNGIISIDEIQTQTQTNTQIQYEMKVSK